MSVLKKYPLGLCAVLGVIFFLAIYPLSVSPYTGAYYVLLFNAMSIIGFVFVLYYALTKSLTKNKITKLIWVLSILCLPHIPLSLLSYGSWVCLGMTIIINLTLLWSKSNVI